MIKVLTGNQMRDVDNKAIKDLKIPGLILMENAGRAVCEEILDILADNKENHHSVVVICGKGNNGGDGFVAARHLEQNSIQTTVISLYRKEELSGSALINHDIYENFGEIIYLDEIPLEELKNIIAESTIVIDAIFGTGLSAEIKGQIREIIEIINEFSEGYVVSVDIPSGIDATTGKVLGQAVAADSTVTFFAPKLGSVLFPGAEYSGEVIVAEIGIPEYLTESPEYNINLITQHHASLLLPIRPNDSHKGTFGSVFNLAGSLGLTGAAYMSAISALKSGAGYSTIATAESLIPIFSSMTPEITYVPLKETMTKAISAESVNEALDKSQKYNSFLIGPGIGTDLSTVEFIYKFTQKLVDRGIGAIFDADALNCIASRENFVLPLNSVITPHPKELSRLLKISVEEILEDRIKAARLAAEKFNVITVLKGARTIIARPDGVIYINLTGNSALATAGSGDVLSGMIAGFIAQGLNPENAAILGVYLHGLAGDLASESLTEYSVTAMDVIDYIPNAIKVIQE